MLVIKDLLELSAFTVTACCNSKSHFIEALESTTLFLLLNLSWFSGKLLLLLSSYFLVFDDRQILTETWKAFPILSTVAKIINKKL